MRGIHSVVEGAVGLAAGLVLVSATGCAGQRAVLGRQVSRLQDQITVLENANDRLEERIAALELSQATGSIEESSKEREPARPELDVVKLAPEPDSASTPEAAQSEQPTPVDPKQTQESQRPLIHGTGDTIETTMPNGPTSLRDVPRLRRATGVAVDQTSLRAFEAPPGRART